MNMNGQNTIINIGRQFGSGGKLIALKISETLGVPVYDNELISKAADESGFSKELFERSDEKRSIFNISSFFGTGRFGGAQNYVGDNELFKIQSEVIRDIAAKGPAIFVGRCSNYILRDSKCLDVFVCAPLEDRVKGSPKDWESARRRPAPESEDRTGPGRPTTISSLSATGERRLTMTSASTPRFSE